MGPTLVSNIKRPIKKNHIGFPWPGSGRGSCSEGRLLWNNPLGAPVTRQDRLFLLHFTGSRNQTLAVGVYEPGLMSRFISLPLSLCLSEVLSLRLHHMFPHCSIMKQQTTRAATIACICSLLSEDGEGLSGRSINCSALVKYCRAAVNPSAGTCRSRDRRPHLESETHSPTNTHSQMF